MTDDTVALIQRLSSLGDELSSDRSEDQSVRNEALLLSRKITASLEQPQNVAVDLAFSVRQIPLLLHVQRPPFSNVHMDDVTLVSSSPGHTNFKQPFLAMAARVADGLDLFKHIASSNGPVTSRDLAALSRGEELLIGTDTGVDFEFWNVLIL